MGHMVLCVMKSGTTKMHLWSVIILDFLDMVSKIWWYALLCFDQTYSTAMHAT